jgi:hypothetical protein
MSLQRHFDHKKTGREITIPREREMAKEFEEMNIKKKLTSGDGISFVTWPEREKVMAANRV